MTAFDDDTDDFEDAAGAPEAVKEVDAEKPRPPLDDWPVTLEPPRFADQPLPPPTEADPLP